jgi:hypothetical protein
VFQGCVLAGIYEIPVLENEPPRGHVSLPVSLSHARVSFNALAGVRGRDKNPVFKIPDDQKASSTAKVVGVMRVVSV